MPIYQCDYISDGQRRSCRLRAPSTERAAEAMRRLAWAPGCGPIGAPKRLGQHRPVALTLAQFVAAALVVASLSAAATLLKPDTVEFAAGEALTQAR